MENWEKEGIITFDKIFNFLLVACFAFLIGYFLCSKNNKNTRPVEEIVKADSLVKINDSIKIVVNNLDSIKNAKIIEVQTLDNDSTLSLFYELISK